MEWSHGNAELTKYVEEQQRIALQTYEINPVLLREHVGQEESFRAGGYGKRQISELLQNAVDALTHSGKPGKVEFRVADGALYCANEGAPFDRDGVQAVCYAFLSTKREDQIGRFGLGFKSVLGVTDRPQVFSTSVSFEFNAPATAQLLGDIDTDFAKMPTLRVPSLVDFESEAESDPNLRDLMSWATTVVKLPLVNDGARIRKEVSEFKSQSLLFMKSVDSLSISLQDGEGRLSVQEHRREGDVASGTVFLHSPGAEPVEWMFAERQHQPSEAVLKTLGATAGRRNMTVSYAVPVDGRSEIGQFWAWFPLLDQTTARGIFNAPWQVNDDRTTMIPGSALNSVLLEVCAELFIEVVSRASTASDPAAHLTLFPARGREARSAADTTLSERIPELARVRPMIPDANGVLQLPGHFRGVPELKDPIVPPLQMEEWQSVISRKNIPHWKCFTTGTRAARLRALMRNDENTKSAGETSVSKWLTELVQPRNPESIRAALRIYRSLKNSGFSSDSLGGSLIIPTDKGGWARADSTTSVLLPVAGLPAPDGLQLVDELFVLDQETRELLLEMGYNEVSVDQTATALATSARGSWDGEHWERFWKALGTASAHAALAALRSIRERDVDVMVKTRAGAWRRAMDVLTDDRFAPDLENRHVDRSLHSGRDDLLRAAGCLDEPASGFQLWNEPIYKDYTTSVTDLLRKRIQSEGHRPGKIVIPDFTGSGPLQLFIELGDDHASLMIWTLKILGTMETATTNVQVPLISSRQSADLLVFTPEMWAVQKFGLVQTSLGTRRIGSVAGSALHQFGSLIPIAAGDVSPYLDVARSLQDLPDSILETFLEHEKLASAGAAQLAALLVECASRSGFVATRVIPAVSRGTIQRQPAADVVLAMTEEDVTLLDEHGVAYIDGTVDGADTLIEHWGLRTSEEALSRSLEIQEAGGEIPLLDKFPSLSTRSRVPLGKVRLRTSPAILRKTVSPTGQLETRLMSARLDDLIIVDDSLDEHQVLIETSRQLGLALSAEDINATLRDDDALRRNELVEHAKVANSDSERLLILVGAAALMSALPKGLLSAVEDKRGKQTDVQIAELYWEVRGFDSLWVLRDPLREIGLNVPTQWAGSDAAQAFVFSLGFSTSYAGVKSVVRPPVVQVQGRIELNPLHPFQETLATEVRDLALNRQANGEAQRGLLFLPTGAGKTRVTVEAVTRMLLAGELSGPVLWIAQSQELCEQAIQTWTDVWRAIGDERVIDICRFWGSYEVDESNEEIQIVVAVDDKLRSRIESSDARHYNWLAQPSLVIIDEAHTALSPTYTGILRWLGLTAAKTTRPLLGLTATPYRGRNPETNRRFVERFGSKKLDALDPDDPIGELRKSRVLAEVDHAVLDGMQFTATGNDIVDFGRMKEVSKSMLDRIGQDLDRTQTLVNDVLRQDASWPILIFAASVASAHTIAALLRLDGKEAAAVDGSMRGQERRRVIDQFRNGELQILVNCDLLTQGFDAPKVRALYVARPTFSPNRYHQMIGRGLRGPENGGKERCLIVNMVDTFDQFGEELAFTEFDYLWSPSHSTPDEKRMAPTI